MAYLGKLDEYFYFNKKFFAAQDETGVWWFSIKQLWKILSLDNLQLHWWRVPDTERYANPTYPRISAEGIWLLIEELGPGHSFTRNLYDFMVWAEHRLCIRPRQPRPPEYFDDYTGESDPEYVLNHDRIPASPRLAQQAGVHHSASGNGSNRASSGSLRTGAGSRSGHRPPR